jgi:hypothetical protein
MQVMLQKIGACFFSARSECSGGYVGIRTSRIMTIQSAQALHIRNRLNVEYKYWYHSSAPRQIVNAFNNTASHLKI